MCPSDSYQDKVQSGLTQRVRWPADGRGCPLIKWRDNISLRGKTCVGWACWQMTSQGLEVSIYVLTPPFTTKQKSVMCIRSNMCLSGQYTRTLEKLHHNFGTQGQALPSSCAHSLHLLISQMCVLPAGGGGGGRGFRSSFFSLESLISSGGWSPRTRTLISLLHIVTDNTG